MDMANLQDEGELARAINTKAKYFLGDAAQREAAVPRGGAAHMSSTRAVHTNAAGIPHLNDSNRAHPLTAESGLFPALFPGGKGYNKGDMKMLDYIKQRCQQLFSPFTLCKEYVLAMSMVRAVLDVTNKTTETVLEDAFFKEKKKHPHLPDQLIYKKLQKRYVPAAVVGSPSYHRNALENLKAVVDIKGIPSLFVTLTADEGTQLRWREVEDMEAFIQGWMAGGTWVDMPGRTPSCSRCAPRSSCKGPSHQHQGVSWAKWTTGCCAMTAKAEAPCMHTSCCG